MLSTPGVPRSETETARCAEWLAPDPCSKNHSGSKRNSAVNSWTGLWERVREFRSETFGVQAVYDPHDPPRPLSSWCTIFEADGRVIYSGPSPMPEEPPSPEADDPPDEPHIVG